MIRLVVAASLLSVSAQAHTSRFAQAVPSAVWMGQITCADVRYAVATLGADTILRMARAAGITPNQERKARRCLR